MGRGVLASALTLTTRRWSSAWAGAFGGGFVSVDGVLAIWSRQSFGGDLGIGLVVAVVVGDRPGGELVPDRLVARLSRYGSAGPR
ncbi:hypothetical protein BU204_25080 [Actinophytocola xanthii]|uniref:Uncharacterized protein n=1 Tax=Actinophytocola xanthii TaxID=1912961 RepID=A0A1Q8CKE2_9PSEU|nr:hypothetical protein BU204_25080 [Actinophytocola xanthii]